MGNASVCMNMTEGVGKETDEVPGPLFLVFPHQ